MEVVVAALRQHHPGLAKRLDDALQAGRPVKLTVRGTQSQAQPDEEWWETTRSWTLEMGSGETRLSIADNLATIVGASQSERSNCKAGNPIFPQHLDELLQTLKNQPGLNIKLSK